jgi:hypothetical protein
MLVSLISFPATTRKITTSKLCKQEQSIAITSYQALDKLCDNYEGQDITRMKVYHFILLVKTAAMAGSWYICAS